MLYANQYSTNFGNSWQRGFSATIILVLICFGVYCHLLGFKLGTGQPHEKSLFWNLLAHAPQYLNPFRDGDSIIPNRLLPDCLFVECKKDLDECVPIMPGWAVFWDYLSRIIIAFFVYQTIQAFRKLGKTGS